VDVNKNQLAIQVCAGMETKKDVTVAQKDYFEIKGKKEMKQ